MDHSHHTAHHHHPEPEALPDVNSGHHKQTHDKHAGHHTHDFLKRFWVCLLLTIPVLLLSHMIQQWLGFEIKFIGEKYLLLTFVILKKSVYLQSNLKKQINT